MVLFSDSDALLASLRALCGSVTPELRALDVKCFTESQTLYLRFYYDGEATEDRIDLWECIITETSAAFGPDCELDAAIIRLDYPQKIPRLGRYAYLRKEPIALELVDQFESHLPVQREFIHFQNDIGLFISPVDESAYHTQWGIAHICESVEIVPAKPETCSISIEPTIAYAQLAVQQTILGTVIPELVVIVVDVKDNLLYIRFYYEGCIEKATIKKWERAITQTWADLGPSYTLDAQIESSIYPQPMFLRGRYAYRRQEPQGRAPWPYVEID